jgi:hypothetical protein
MIDGKLCRDSDWTGAKIGEFRESEKFPWKRFLLYD